LTSQTYSKHQCSVWLRAALKLETSTEKWKPDPQGRYKEISLADAVTVINRAHVSRVEGTKMDILHCVLFSEGRHLKAKPRK